MRAAGAKARVTKEQLPGAPEGWEPCLPRRLGYAYLDLGVSLTLTVICFGLACSVLGKVTVKIPSSNVASAFPVSRPSGRAMALWNEPERCSRSR